MTESTITPSEFLASLDLEKYLAEIDKDFDAAQKTAKAILASGAIGYFPGHLVSSLKADLARAVSAEGRFNGAMTKATFAYISTGAEPNLQPVTSAYTKYVIALEILENTNARFKAIVDSQLAEMTAMFFHWVLFLHKDVKKELDQMKEILDQLVKDLKAAQRKVEDKTAKRDIGVAITIASSVAAGFATGGTAWAIQGGAFVVSVAVDAYYSGGKPSMESAGIDIVGAAVDGAVEHKKSKANIGGPLASAINIVNDSKDIDKAKAAMGKVTQNLAKARKKIARLQALLSTTAPLAKGAMKGWEAAKKSAKSKAGFARSSTKREALLRELETWQREAPVPAE